MAILQDPTGAAFGLWQPLGHGGFGVKGAHGSFPWCEAYSRDHDATRDFHAEMMELDPQPLDHPMGTMTYTTLHRDHPVCGVMQMGRRERSEAPSQVDSGEVRPTKP